MRDAGARGWSLVLWSLASLPQAHKLGSTAAIVRAALPAEAAALAAGNGTPQDLSMTLWTLATMQWQWEEMAPIVHAALRGHEKYGSLTGGTMQVRQDWEGVYVTGLRHDFNKAFKLLCACICSSTLWCGWVARAGTHSMRCMHMTVKDSLLLPACLTHTCMPSPALPCSCTVLRQHCSTQQAAPADPACSPPCA